MRFPQPNRLLARTAHFASVLSLSLLTLCAHAQVDADTDARIKAAIEQHTQGKVIIGSVAKAPIPGIFEVTSGMDVFYVDASGRYGFVNGRLVDLAESRDLTAPRLDELSRIDFRKLPLPLAIKEVHGSGRRELAIFEDPGCPVCRSLSKFLDQLPDVTIYRFMFPVTDPASVDKAKAAWCAKDKRQAWSQLMQGGPAPTSPPCDVQALERVMALGDELHIIGTPTVFLGNGRRLEGATPPDQFIQALDDSARSAR